MKMCKYQILITTLFALALGLVYSSNLPREDVVYLTQALILGFGVIASRSNSALRTSFALLLAADFIYYILVYKFNIGTANKYVVIGSSFAYFASFTLFAFFLLRNNWQNFWSLVKKPTELPVVLFFIAIASYYILIPGLEKLVHEGPSYAHLSNLITLTSSLPLAIVSYIFLTNGHPQNPRSVIVGFFILAILDIGIQTETIMYGDLKFSFYDILWFFGVYLISFSAKRFATEKIVLLQRTSIGNLIKKIFFISALFPMIGFYFLTKNLFNLPPMYFIFIVVSIFIFGIGVSKLVERRIGHYNLLMRKILSDQSEIGIETIVRNSPVEFHDSVFAVFNKVIEKDVQELTRQKAQLLEMRSVYRKMAHDLASPIRVLDIISRTSIDMDPDRKNLLNQATQRVRKIADDILHRGRTTSDSYHRSSQSISTQGLVTGIKSLILEKKIEFQNRTGRADIELNIDIRSNGNLMAEEEELIRILSNLINNSRDALGSHNDGLITVSLVSSRGHLEIEIRDNGPGFPKEVLDHQFISPISISKANGHGLGLFTCARIVQKWQGKLEIFNDSGAVIRLQIKNAAEDTKSYLPENSYQIQTASLDIIN